MTAEEAILAELVLIRAPGEEQQVAIVRLLLQHGEVHLRNLISLTAQGKELPVAIMTDVQREAGAPGNPAVADRCHDLEAGADVFKGTLEMFEFHLH